MVENGQDDHIGQHDLIPNRISAFAGPTFFGPFWPDSVKRGPYGSANRAVATPE